MLRLGVNIDHVATLRQARYRGFDHGEPCPVDAVRQAEAAGAHGIMTLNDFKALEGDAQMGVDSLPVTLGPEKAARVACAVMLVPQLGVVALLIAWAQPWHAGGIAALVLAQVWAMSVMLQDPRAKAPWYNGTGVLMYISGMMIAAFALRSLEVL